MTPELKDALAYFGIHPQETPQTPEETPEGDTPALPPLLPIVDEMAEGVKQKRELRGGSVFRIDSWFAETEETVHTFRRDGEPTYRLKVCRHRTDPDRPSRIVWYQPYGKIERRIDLIGRTVETYTENTDDEDKHQTETRTLPTRAAALAYAVSQLLTEGERYGMSTEKTQGVL